MSVPMPDAAATQDDSQDTVYEPMHQAFATLTPANAAARLAFHDVVEAACMSQHQVPGAPDLHHPSFMNVNPEPEYYLDASLPRADDGSASDTPTDPETQTDQPAATDAVKIWTGCYFFTMAVIPFRPDLGWMAGKGRPGEEPDFLLTTKQRPNGIRGRHAFFMFNSETRFLSVARASRAVVDLSVDGVPIKGPHAFNRSKARVRIGGLEYLFEYTDYARTTAFYEERDQFLTTVLGWSKLALPAITPTPAPQAISVGEWTITAAAGKGGFGKVSIASNTRNEVVAIKMMERNSRSELHIAHEVATFRTLTELIKAEGETRLVRLREVIYQHGKEKYQPPGLEEVSFVLEPVVRKTFSELIYTGERDSLLSIGGEVRDGQTSLTWIIHLLHDALLGVRFLHSHDWIHGDLKPANIGIEPKPATGPSDLPWRVVLLDIGDAIKKKTMRLTASPGQGGTVNYLAPEREIADYDETVDIWAMGVVAFEFICGYHPWKFSKNPWRRGREYEFLREQWHGKYQQAMDRLQEDDDVGNLLRRMLRHRWARDREQRRHRWNIDETLRHPCWHRFGKDDGSDDARSSKRTRTSQ